MATRTKGATAARRKEQSALRAYVAKSLGEAGATSKENEYQVVWTLDTVRVGRFTFTSHKRDEKEAGDLFSVYVRADLDRTREDVHAAGELIMAAFHTGSRHFNGKLNIHSSTREGAEMELDRYLHWMMQPHEEPV